MGISYLPRFMQLFQETYPQVHTQVHIQTTAQTEAMLLNGALDLCNRRRNHPLRNRLP
ncbi:MAG: LysR substrate-binding domain-containing protein [Clostridium fessum]